MAPRTHTRKPGTSKTATTKATANKTAKPARPNTGTTVDLRHPLPTRRRSFVGPHKPAELAAIRAALASAAARLPVPVRAWNGPIAHLADGTTLRHTPTAATTDQPPQFIAHIPCPHGATHQHHIHTARDLANARTLTAACQAAHGTPEHAQALTHGPAPTVAPKPPAVLQLREGIRRATVSAADTQPLSTDDITTGLANRDAADQPKEHPQL